MSWDKQLAYPIFFVIDEDGRRWAKPRIKAMGFAPPSAIAISNCQC
ncbi:MAG: hypothetical protein KME57_25010 [Scytonema hyalinum WJT4-NPBG1]|nr:hypothetical protein [Scytonema hyalinum WJT4-NPBG1]